MKLAINSEYKLDFSSPFDTLNSNTVYTVISIMDITEMEQNGLQPYELIYKPVGLDKSVMYQDISNHVKIVTLKATTGYLYIPESYIDTTKVPESGVMYNKRALIFSICAIPESEDLSDLVSDIQLLIQSRIGISPAAESLVVSAPSLISLDKHKIFSNARDTIKTNKSNYALRVNELIIENNNLKEEIDNLKCVICNS